MNQEEDIARSDKQEKKVVTLHVSGICCGSEVPMVEKALRHDMVHTVHVNVLQRHVTIEHDARHAVETMITSLKVSCIQLMCV